MLHGNGSLKPLLTRGSFSVNNTPMSKEDKEYVGLGGFTAGGAAGNTPDYMRHARKACVVSATPERGGQREPVLMFKGFEATKDGLIITEPRSTVHPAEPVKELSPSSLGHLQIASELGVVLPPIVNQPTPAGLVIPSEAQIKTLGGETSSVPTPTLKAIEPTKIATFIGERRDDDLPCVDIFFEAPWLTLVSPTKERFKLKANEEMEISINGVIRKFFFTGIANALSSVDLTVRVFLLDEKESASQEEGASV